jgi:hypothetical protein
MDDAIKFSTYLFKALLYFISFQISKTCLTLKQCAYVRMGGTIGYWGDKETCIGIWEVVLEHYTACTQRKIG